CRACLRALDPRVASRLPRTGSQVCSAFPPFTRLPCDTRRPVLPPGKLYVSNPSSNRREPKPPEPDRLGRSTKKGTRDGPHDRTIRHAQGLLAAVAVGRAGLLLLLPGPDQR